MPFPNCQGLKISVTAVDTEATFTNSYGVFKKNNLNLLPGIDANRSHLVFISHVIQEHTPLGTFGEDLCQTHLFFFTGEKILEQGWSDPISQVEELVECKTGLN